MTELGPEVNPITGFRATTQEEFAARRAHFLLGQNAEELGMTLWRFREANPTVPILDIIPNIPPGLDLTDHFVAFRKAGYSREDLDELRRYYAGGNQPIRDGSM